MASAWSSCQLERQISSLNYEYLLASREKELVKTETYRLMTPLEAEVFKLMQTVRPYGGHSAEKRLASLGNMGAVMIRMDEMGTIECTSDNSKHNLWSIKEAEKNG